MSLTIERFRSRCHVSPRARLQSGQVERFVRERVLGVWASRLGERWPEEDAVIRIRRIVLKLSLTPEGLAAPDAAERWAEALSEALRRALSGGQVEIIRAANRAEWIGRYLLEVRAGTARDRWEFGEFGAEASSFVQTSLATLACAAAQSSAVSTPSRGSALVAATLQWISSQGRLDQWLSGWDESALLQLCRLLDSPSAHAPGLEISAADLALVARTAHRLASKPSGRLATRRRAITLHLALAVQGVAMSAEDVHAALQTLDALLENSPAAAPLLSGRWPNRVAASWLAVQRTGTGSGNAELREALQLLRSQQEEKPDSVWLESEGAGLFLLVERLRRLGWLTLGRQTSLAAIHGPRLDGYLLAGIACAILDPTGEQPIHLPVAVAFFAGWFGEPSLAEFRDFLNSGSALERRELLESLLAESSSEITAAAASWESAFNLLAAALVRDFAATLRALRNPTQEFIVVQFLALSGFLLLKPDALFVRLDTNSYQALIRVAHADDPVPLVGWLGGRRLEFARETS